MSMVTFSKVGTGARKVLEDIGIIRPPEVEEPPARADLVERYETLTGDLEERKREVTAEILALREERAAAVEEARAMHRDQLAELDHERHELDGRDHKAREIEQALRATCHPALRESGPVVEWLRAVRYALGRHMSTEDSRHDLTIRDLERREPDANSPAGRRLARLKRDRKHRFAAKEIRERVDAALERVRQAQLAADLDVPAFVEEIRDEIPTHGPTGEMLPALGGGTGVPRG